MTKRPCLTCGTPTTNTRCPNCTRLADRQRQQAKSNRYGPEHQALRRAWKPHVETGLINCTRCGTLIAPNDTWALDHRPDGSYPAHTLCNNRAGGQGQP